MGGNCISTPKPTAEARGVANKAAQHQHQQPEQRRAPPPAIIVVGNTASTGVAAEHGRSRPNRPQLRVCGVPVKYVSDIGSPTSSSDPSTTTLPSNPLTKDDCGISTSVAGGAPRKDSVNITAPNSNMLLDSDAAAVVSARIDFASQLLPSQIQSSETPVRNPMGAGATAIGGAPRRSKTVTFGEFSSLSLSRSPNTPHANSSFSYH